MSNQAPLQRIEAIGFRKCGHWEVIDSDGILAVLSEYAQSANVLYAFVSEGEVLYVGKTTQQLRKRLYGYQNPRITQTTNVRGNKAICDALALKKQIYIFALPDNGLVKIGGFHLNLAAALEDSLINDLRPKWNKRFGREDARAKEKDFRNKK